LNYNVPKIYQKTNNSLDIEYIHGIDIYTFLKLYNSDIFVEFIIKLVDNFRKLETINDYTDVYIKKLDEIEDYHSLPFTKNEFLCRLPSKLPQSMCHGDLTLDNIIFSKNEFYMIDCSTGGFDSWVFDLAKLRQDLKCKWCVRNVDDKSLYNCLDLIDSTLAKLYPVAFNDDLLILMLLRVLIYTKKNSYERKFIIENIKSLWK
jgi:hypothetical protein